MHESVERRIEESLTYTNKRLRELSGMLQRNSKEKEIVLGLLSVTGSAIQTIENEREREEVIKETTEKVSLAKLSK